MYQITGDPQSVYITPNSNGATHLAIQDSQSGSITIVDSVHTLMVACVSNKENLAYMAVSLVQNTWPKVRRHLGRRGEQAWQGDITAQLI